MPHDRDYILGSFDPNLGLVQEGVQIKAVHNSDQNNFGPRVGFAWDMFGTGKTVLRAGGSIIFELTPMQIYVETGNATGAAGAPTAWVIGCSTGPNTFDTDPAAGLQTIPASSVSNCGTASGGTYADPLTRQNMTSAAGFNFQPGQLSTSGGTRAVGQVSWSRGNNNIVNVVNWDSSATGIFPGSGILNCNPAISVRDGATGTATNGRAGATCDITAMDRHLVTPYIETWTLSLQHAIVNNVVLDIAYVGNHGVKLIGRTNDNQPRPGSGWNSTLIALCNSTPSSGNCNGDSSASNALSVAARPFRTKFSSFNNIVRVWNPMTSNYNGLQMTLTARNFHGISMTSGYTYAKALDVASTSGAGLQTDSYDVGLDYGRANSDLRHRFTLSGVYQVPGVMGYGGLLQGWKLNGIFRYQTGRPWAGGAANDFQGTDRTTRWDFKGDASDFVADYHGVDLAVFHPAGTTVPSGINPRTGVTYVASDLAINTAQCTSAARSAATLQAFGCWTQGGSTITPPPVNSFGNMARGLFSGPTYWALDFSVSKRQTITERLTAEFRAETFNTLNHPAIGQPATGLTSCTIDSCTFGRPSNTPAVAATNSYLGNGGPRRMQFGIKLIF
ncbi:MAG TPA: hypothetical protein VJL59_13205 [Anaerolineales bacterium]|nr:hypothetical protein [Anaerolineales bacterium]